MQNAGLEDFIPVFERNGIEYSDLHELSDKDLKEDLDMVRLKDRKVFKKALDVSANTPWYKEVYDDEDCWCNEIIQAPSTLIGYEYRRLRELTGHGQIFGMMLEIKDIFEIMLKIPVLLIATLIFKNKKRSDFENKTIFELLHKPPSLGDWERIASSLNSKKERSEMSTSIDPKLLSYLSQILDAFRKNKLTNWRNETIGHGALGLPDDEDFIIDIRKKVKVINDVLQKNCDYLKNIEYRNDPPCFIINAIHYPFFPFFDIHKELVIFDSYNRKKRNSIGLNYQLGKRYSMNIPSNIFEDQIESHNKIKELNETSNSKKYGNPEVELNRSVIPNQYLEFLDSLVQSKDWIYPNYLIEWLNRAMEKTNSGYLLLQMERGMGKSFFSNMLENSPKDIPEHVPTINYQSVVIKAYYLNDTFRCRIDVFYAKLEKELKNLDGENLLFNFVELPSGMSWKQKLAYMLNHSLRIYRGNRKDDELKFLFILDGVDEVPAHSHESILDHLPTSEQLDPGVLILLNMRTNQELTEYTKGFVSTLVFSDTLCVQRNDKENLHILEKYVSQNIVGNKTIHDSSYLEILYEKSDYRLLHLHLMKELIVVGNFDLQSLPDSKNLFDFYLAHLEICYGEKYYSHVKELLVILSTAYEELTIEEIAYLSGMGYVSFKLIAMIVDVRGMIKTIRSSRGNLLSISHPELIHRINEGSDTTSIVQNMANYSDPIIKNEIDNFDQNSDGESYLMSYILAYYNDWQLKLEWDYSSRLTFNAFLDIANKLISNDDGKIKDKCKYNRSELLLKRGVNLLELLLLESPETNRDLFKENFIGYKLLAKGYNRLGQIQKEREKLLITKSISELSLLSVDASVYADILLSLFIAYVVTGEIDDAQKLADQIEKNHIDELDDQLKFFENRARMTQILNLWDQTHEILLRARSKAQNSLEEARIDIAIAKNYRKRGEVKQAKDLLNKILQDDSHIKNKLEKAKALIEIGLCHVSDKNYPEALVSYEEAQVLIDLFDNHEWRIHNWLGISTVYELLGKFEDSLSLSLKVYEEAKEYGYQNSYIDSMNLLARRYICLGDYDKGKEYAKRAGDRWEIQGARDQSTLMESHKLKALAGKYQNTSGDSDKAKIISEGEEICKNLESDRSTIQEIIYLRIIDEGISIWHNRETPPNRWFE